MTEKKIKSKCENKQVFLEVDVPFEFKQTAIELGAQMLLPEERTSKKIWYVNNEKKKKMIEKYIEDFLNKKNLEEMTYSSSNDKNNEETIPQNESKEESEDVKKIDSCCKSEISFELEIDTYDSFDWSRLLSEGRWNSLKVVQAIKEHGLPKTKEQRIIILTNLARREPGSQFNVVYEDICEYCEAFDKAYGWDVVKRALKAGGILNGFHLKRKVKESRLPLEVKKILLYVFPVVKRENIDCYDSCTLDEENEIEVDSFLSLYE